MIFTRTEKSYMEDPNNVDDTNTNDEYDLNKEDSPKNEEDLLNEDNLRNKDGPKNEYNLKNPDEISTTERRNEIPMILRWNCIQSMIPYPALQNIMSHLPGRKWECKLSVFLYPDHQTQRIK